MVGAGVGRRLAEVKWSMAGRMVIAWVLTLPAAAAVGALAGRLAKTGTAGVLIVAVVGLVLAGAINLAARRRPVHAGNVNDGGPSAPAAQPVRV